MNALLDRFDAVHIVHLAARTDRRAEMSAQLRKVGVAPDDPKVHWLDATKPTVAAGFPTIGTHGCFLSHLAVLRRAVALGQRRILLLEDDLNFSADFLQRQGDAVAAMASGDWSVFYACQTIKPPVPPAGPGDAPWVRLDPGQPVVLAHWLALQGDILPALVAYLEAILRRPPGHPDGGPMHVDGAYTRFRAEHPRHTTLLLREPLGQQRASRTDIGGLQWFDRLWGVRALAQLARRQRNA